MMFMRENKFSNTTALLWIVMAVSIILTCLTFYKGVWLESQTILTALAGITALIAGMTTTAVALYQLSKWQDGKKGE